MMQHERRSNGCPGTSDRVLQEIILREQQHVAAERFINIAFVVAGVHFNFALSELRPAAPPARDARQRRKVLFE